MKKALMVTLLVILLIVTCTNALAFDNSGSVSRPFTGSLVYVYPDGTAIPYTQTIGTLFVNYSIQSNTNGYTGASLTGSSISAGSLTTASQIINSSGPSISLSNNNQVITVSFINWQTSITYRYKYLISSTGAQTLSGETLTANNTFSMSRTHR